MKSLVWQQNRRQKVFNEGGFTFVQWSLTFENLNKHHCFIILHISIRGLDVCFRGAKPTKDPVVTGLYGKTSACFINAADSEK